MIYPDKSELEEYFQFKFNDDINNWVIMAVNKLNNTYHLINNNWDNLDNKKRKIIYINDYIIWLRRSKIKKLINVK